MCCAYYLIDLELTFTSTLLCPWDGQSIDTPLVEDGRSKTVTEDNKVYGYCLVVMWVDLL